MANKLDANKNTIDPFPFGFFRVDFLPATTIKCILRDETAWKQLQVTPYFVVKVLFALIPS